MMTVSFAGGLLLIPAFLMSNVTNNPIIFAVYFACVVGLMFLEHFRRMKVVGLPWIMTFTWIVYRVILLAFII